MKSLDVVYCKDCSSCIHRVIDSNSTLYGCKKDKCFDMQPNLYCNKPCYTKKKFRKKK